MISEPTTREHFEWFCDQFNVQRWSHGGNRAHCLCPNHADHTPSLDIDHKDGAILMTCRAGCKNTDILDRVNLDVSAYWRMPIAAAGGQRPPGPPTPKTSGTWGAPTGEWNYTRVNGELFGKVRRFDPPGMRKQFIPYHVSGNGLAKGVGPEPWPLYRADLIASLSPGSLVFLVAGEKCAGAVAALGLNATTHQGGEPKWEDRYATLLAGFDVIVCEDNDPAGRAWGAQVARSLVGVADNVRIVQFPELPEKGDVFDWLANGHDRDDLIDRALSAQPVTPDKTTKTEGTVASPSLAMVDVPDFPISVFPEAIQTYVLQGANAIGAPVDFVAVPLIGFIAGIAGNRRPIKIKGGWTERPILWPVIVGKPGTAKTPAIKHAQAPIDVLQKRAFADYQERMEYHEQQMAEQKSRKGSIPEPRLEHLYSTDITLEALGANLEGSPGMSVIREEIVGWVESHDAYRKGGDRQSYLSLWAGAALKVDRRTSGTVYVPQPAVSVVGGIQPDLIPRLKEEAGRQDGFLDRFLFSWPDAHAMGWTDFEVDPCAIDPVVMLLRDIRDIAPDDPANAISWLGKPARDEFKQWMNANAAATEQLSGLAAGFNAKLPTQLARFITILHALNHPKLPGSEVPAETVLHGIELAEYFRGHLARVLPCLGSDFVAPSAPFRRRVRTKIGSEWIGRSQVRDALGRRGFTTDQFDTALQDLEAEGEIVSRVTQTEGRPRTEYREKISHMPKGSPEPDLRDTGYFPPSNQPKRSWDCICGMNLSLAIHPDRCPSCGHHREAAA